MPASRPSLALRGDASAGPSTTRGDRGPGRDIRGATLFVHAALPRSPRCRERAAVRAGRARHLRQTSCLRPVRSATELQLSCVSCSFSFCHRGAQFRRPFARKPRQEAASTACKPARERQVSRYPPGNIFFGGNELEGGRRRVVKSRVSLARRKQQVLRFAQDDKSILSNPTFQFGPVLDWNYEFQARPNLGYRTYFDIDEAGVQTEFANQIFGQVGGDSRTFLWPRDPQHTRGRQGLRCPPQLNLQSGARLGTQQNEVEIFVDNASHPAFHQRVAQQGFDVIGYMQKGGAKIVLDAQLLRQRSSGITSHVLGP